MSNVLQPDSYVLVISFDGVRLNVFKLTIYLSIKTSDTPTVLSPGLPQRVAKQPATSIVGEQRKQQKRSKWVELSCCGGRKRTR